ncbi:MAG: thioredoxin domain-containing protein, partial [bacterium]
YRITKNKFFLFVAEDTAQYVLNNLQHMDGGFYSAEDAESAIDESKPFEKEEGANYLWQKNEIEEILGKDDSKVFNFYFGIEHHGNTINDPHEVFGTKNVLYIANDLFDTAKQFDKTPEEIARIIDDSRVKLLDERNKRPHPFLDDKILTSWNGLMITALAKIYSVTENEEYLTSAKSAVSFIKKNLYRKESKTLLHRFRDGESKIDGTLEDYAFLISGLIEMYESCFEMEYLTFAIELNRICLEKFYDNENAGFFDVSGEGKDIVLKTKDTYDGAEPSGNSIQIMNLLRIGFISDDKDMIEKAERSLKLFSNDLSKLSFSSPQMLCDLSFYLYSPKEIILSGNADDKKFMELKTIIDQTFIPNKVVMHSGKELEKISAFIANIIADNKNAAAYVCENYVCSLPVADAGKLSELLLPDSSK